jgi:signal transduction histidine kinase
MDPVDARLRLVGSAFLPLALLFGQALSAGSRPEPDQHPLPLLTEIKSIRALSQDGGARGYPVRIRGIVTHFDEVGKNSLIINDGRFGQFVTTPADVRAVGPWNEMHAGDLIEIDGRTERGGFAPNVRPERVRKIGQAALPAVRIIPYSAMLTGRHDCEFVEIDGVVQRTWLSSDATRTRLMFAEVATEEGIVRTSFWEYTPGDLTKFIDARVRIRGNVGTIFGQTEQLRGVSLFGGRIRDLIVLEAAPDPFGLPARQIRGIYNYSSTGEVNRRIRVQGVVTAVVAGHPVEVADFTTTATFRYVVHVLYVKDRTGGVRIESEQSPDARPGQVVQAAGFPGVTPGRPVLRNAVFKVVGTEQEPAAMPVTGSNLLTPEYDAELVRLNGQLLSVLTGPVERILVLKAGETVFNAGLDAKEAGGLDRLRSGSIVSVTGVYSYRGGPPPSFRLFARTAADVHVLAVAPWWTLRHTAVMAMMLAVVAGVGAVGMRTQARRKRREYQAVLTERTRVARELHDTLEQGLAGIALQLEAVEGSLKSSPDVARRSLDVARQMLRYSLEETRRSIRDLRSQALDSRDLAGALTSLARQMTIGTNAEARVRVFGAPRRLNASDEHHLLRIGLEALTNALKHAHPTSIEIDIRFDPGNTKLIVRDDGCGLGHGAHDLPDGHFGLRGIRERVDKLGGSLQIDSYPGRGTRLAVSIPERQDTTTFETQTV